MNSDNWPTWNGGSFWGAGGTWNSGIDMAPGAGHSGHCSASRMLLKICWTYHTYHTDPHQHHHQDFAQKPMTSMACEWPQWSWVTLVLQKLYLGGTIRHVRRSRWKKTTKSLQIRPEWSLHSSQGRNSEGEEFSLVRPRGSCSKNAGMWKSKFYLKKTIAVSQNLRTIVNVQYMIIWIISIIYIYITINTSVYIYMHMYIYIMWKLVILCPNSVVMSTVVRNRIAPGPVISHRVPCQNSRAHFSYKATSH
jgi:hypothetical protein